MRVATFNLMGGRSITDGRLDPDRLTAAVAALDADVVALQEVDRGQPRSDLRDLAAEAAAAMDAVWWRFVPTVLGTPGGTWRAVPNGVDRERVVPDGPTYGIALLSRRPVVSWSVTTLPAAPVRSPVVVPGPRRPGVVVIRDEPRALVSATVDTPDGPLAVGATHLSFVPGWNVVQARRAVGVLRRREAARHLLVGDLNLPGPLARVATGWHRLVSEPTWPAPAPRIQFDHVLSRHPLPGVEVRVEQLGISDHRAVVVTLPALRPR